MSPGQKKIFYRDRSVGFISSALLHGVLLACGGMVFAQGAQYAVEAGTGGMEVNLVAASAESATEMIEAPEPPKEMSSAPEPDNMPLPQRTIEDAPLPEPKKKESKPLSEVSPTLFRGDGSSPVPGRDAITFQSSGGALAEAKPNYLKNPAPHYPQKARESGWEGVVVLRVAVDKAGRPSSAEIEKGSGFSVLDESALRTVRRWKFRAARLGALAVDSIVRVPIRFELEHAGAGRR